MIISAKIHFKLTFSYHYMQKTDPHRENFTGKVTTETCPEHSARLPGAAGTVALICLLQSIPGGKCILLKLFDKDCLKLCSMKCMMEDRLRVPEPRSRVSSMDHYWHFQYWIVSTWDTEEKIQDKAKLCLSIHSLVVSFLWRWIVS